MVGFNLFNADAVTPNAWLSTSTGLIEISPSTAGYCVSDYIRVFKGQTVHIPGLGSARRWFYDMDKNPSVYMQSALAQLYTPLSDGYIRVTIKKDEYPLDTICINLSSDKNGTYEPYKSYTYPLDSSLILRGIPKLDSANNLYYDGDTYESDGTVTRKYGIVDLGTLTWQYQSTWQSWYTDYISDIKGTSTGTEIPKFISEKYLAMATNYGLTSDDRIGITTTVRASNGCRILVKNGSTTTTPSGYLVYELATPTTETAEPYEEYQHVTNGGTEEYVSTGIVPVGHVTKYPTDIVSKVDGLPSDFSTLIAPTESAMKATRAYTVNQFLIVNNQLYRVTAAIASGATITPNTNVTAVTVADILTSLLNA